MLIFSLSKFTEIPKSSLNNGPLAVVLARGEGMKIKIPVFLISITIGALASSDAFAKCMSLAYTTTCADAGGTICKDGGCYVCCDDSDNGATNTCTGSYTTTNTPFTTSSGSGYYVSYGYNTVCKCIDRGI